MFNGLGMHMGNLSRLSPARTRSISAENPRGEKGRAAMGMEGTGAHFARNIGEGWKVSPSVVVPAGTTYTVADIQIIQPHEVDKIKIQQGRDLLTLITCHPYASGGKQRYVVYCERTG